MSRSRGSRAAARVRAVASSTATGDKHARGTSSPSATILESSTHSTPVARRFSELRQNSLGLMRPEPSVQREELKKLYDFKNPPVTKVSRVRGGFKFKEGEVYCLVSKKWWGKLCEYLRLETKEQIDKALSDDDLQDDAPEMIDNRSLAENDHQEALLMGLEDRKDYVLVPQECWRTIHEWYGGGPEIPRSVIKEGSTITKLTLDLYPAFPTVYFMGKDGRTDMAIEPVKMQFRRSATVAEALAVIQERCEHLKDFEPSELKVWKEFDPAENKIDESHGFDEEAARQLYWSVLENGDDDETLQDFYFHVAGARMCIEYPIDSSMPRSDRPFKAETLMVGDICDARDYEGKWYPGRVLWRQDNKLRVRYIGWTPKWNKWYNLTKYRPRDVRRIAMKLKSTDNCCCDDLNEYRTRTQPKSSVRKHNRSHSNSYMWASGEQKGQPDTDGIVGLCNLGNTCFMNSTIQCILQAPGLTKFYFDESLYKPDINVDNALGWKGEVAEQWALFVQQIWGSKYRVVSPKALKKKIGGFAPRFEGYQQQDSSELLSFLLDGLHEDSNRVKEKPTTTAPDYDGDGDDQEMGQTFWNLHKERNDSVVVDLMMGQYRSTIVCPTTKKKAVTFDPYIFTSLPLPISNEKEQTYIFCHLDPERNPRRFGLTIPKMELVMNFLKTVAKQVSGHYEEEILPERLIMAETWNGDVYKNFKPKELMSSVAAEDEVMVFMTPPPPEKPPKTDEVEKPLAVGDKIYAYWPVDQKEYVATVVDLPKPTDDDDVQMCQVRWSDKREDSVPLRDCRQPPKRKVPDLVNVQIAHRYMKTSSASYTKGTYEEHLGRPIVMQLPSYIARTNAEVKAQIEKRIEPLMTKAGREYRETRKNNCYDLMVRRGVSEFPDDDEVFKFDTIRQATNKWSRKIAYTVFVLWKKKSHYHLEMEDDPSAPAAEDDDGTPRVTRQKSTQKSVHLSDCFDQFCMMEKMDENNEVYCRYCKKHEQSNKTMVFWTIPDLLVLHLKRFSFGGNFSDKVNILVDFPLDGLNIKKWVENTEISEDECIFDCFAVSNHMGGMGGGHYTAYVRSLADGKWYEMDDRSVSEVEDPQSEVVSAKAYVLFFKRRKPNHPLCAEALEVEAEAGGTRSE